MPEKWAGRSARRLFQDRHEAWRAPAEAQWKLLCSS
ncbi:MAG: hypothetical protein M3313_06475 [Actinomycetota bacterium]|nr:hypothetical protein [Actinomycetota bacterium]